MIETIHIWTENPIYCHKLHKILDADQKHLRTECTKCPYFHGTAQGQGTECWYYDGTDNAIVQNVDPHELMRRMASIPQATVDAMIASRAERARQIKLTSALKSLAKTTYEVRKNGAYIGQLIFAKDVAVDLRTQDATLISYVQHMIVNPITWEDRKVPAGAEEYPQALMQALTGLGYELVQD